MIYIAALITFLACTVPSQAQHEPGYCALYDECGRNPLIDSSLMAPIVPCYNYSKARYLTGLHYRKLKEVCPMLDRGEGNTFACCSISQLRSLEIRLSLSKAVLNRCPSCAENFAHIHCINTCSPNQSLTVNVTQVLEVTHLGNTRLMVVGYQSYMSTSFADAAFTSCKNVKIPATGELAISAMCGRYGAELCTPQRWYDYQGDPSNSLVPLDLEFKLIKDGDTKDVPKGVIPYDGRVLRCNEGTPSGYPVCSCQDCPEACPSMLPPP